MKNRRLLLILTLVILAVVAAITLQRMRGPLVPAYGVTEQPLIQTVVATGRVAAVSRAQVGSPVTGVLTERRVQEGDLVKPGDILAIVRADDLEAAVREAQAALVQLQESTLPQAQAARREAQIALDQAAREAGRRRELFREQAISREEMERALQAEVAARAALEQADVVANALVEGNSTERQARARLANAEAQLAKTTIRAEVGGTVLTRNAEPGDLVQPSRVLFEIARDDDTEILVPMDEKNLEVLALGQNARVVADAFPSRPFPATVRFIAPTVDPQRGTIDVRLDVGPDADFLLQDMTVSVNVETGRRDRALVLPNDALQSRNGDRAWVWLAHEGRAMRREIQLGLRGLTHTEIAEGLKAGEQVLVNPPASLQAGDAVRTRGIALRDTSSSPDRATRSEVPVRMD